MNILALSDLESEYLWNSADTARQPVDLILSCGDLDPHYLSFLATYNHAPVLYVHGNHDEGYCHTPPEGCICVEDQINVHQGVRILGLGGSICYNRGKHQYTQAEMNWRVRRLSLSLLRHRGFDLLLTHAPARGIDDAHDLPHQGFSAFRSLLDRFQPRVMVHGHVHLNYGMEFPRQTQYQQTRIINAYERFRFSLDP